MDTKELSEPSFAEISPTVIVGAGLIGASIGCALMSRGVKVHLRDSSTANAQIAAARGAGVLERPVQDEVRLVVVATPPQDVSEVVRISLKEFPNAVVTDVASIKKQIEKELDGSTDQERYIGSHPMAGSAHTGPLTATSDLFEDRTWVVTASYDNPDWVVRRAFMLGTAAGARTVTRSATEHDRAVAEISHVPQIMSSLTAARLTDVPSEDLQLAGQGVRDVTRIAGSDPELWSQIIAANTEEIRNQLIKVQKDLSRLIENLDDPRIVTDLLSRGRQGTKALPARAGKSPDQLVTVTAEIPDKPGAMANMFRVAEEAGVNIEDISMEHDVHRNFGFLRIQVAIEQADILRSALRQHWEEGRLSYE